MLLAYHFSTRTNRNTSILHDNLRHTQELLNMLLLDSIVSSEA